MTTRAAAAAYLAAHLTKMYGKPFVVYNPKNMPIESLPFIYGFNNGGSTYFLLACALSADGVVLGQHNCSDEAYIPHDLGIIEGSRLDRHEESYRVHYPEGYRMTFVPTSEIERHEGLHSAFAAMSEKQLLKADDAVRETRNAK